MAIGGCVCGSRISLDATLLLCGVVRNKPFTSVSTVPKLSSIIAPRIVKFSGRTFFLIANARGLLWAPGDRVCYVPARLCTIVAYDVNEVA